MDRRPDRLVVHRGGARAARDAVKQVLDAFITRREGDRIGLILFGVKPYLQAPLTTDHDVVRTLLADAAIGMAGPQTMLGDAIGLALKLFEDAKVKSRVLILMTDGNDTGSQMPPARAAAIAAERSVTIYAIVAGDPRTQSEKVDMKAMQDVAARTGGRAFLAANREELTGVYQTLDQIEPTKVQTESYRPRQPLFWIPLGAGLMLMVGFYVIMLLTTIVRRPRHVEEAAAR
jgi:Ca-activated chloride channel family protein